MNKESYKVKRLAHARQDCIEHRAQILDYYRKYRKKNRAKILEYRRKYYAEYYAKIAEARKKVTRERRRSETESKWKAWRTGRLACLYPKSINLYIFICLIFGPDIRDNEIARRWKMDTKNFSEFKKGRYPVPRLKRLEQLARMLGVKKHLVFEVAVGTSAKRVFGLIKKNNLPGQIKLLFPEL